MAEARGEISSVDGVLVIRSIHVRYRLKAAPEYREVAERVHRVHAEHCPVARTIGGCVEIDTELEVIGD
jgi:uncharacterized OsmC-like protein